MNMTFRLRHDRTCLVFVALAVSVGGCGLVEMNLGGEGAPKGFAQFAGSGGTMAAGGPSGGASSSGGGSVKGGSTLTAGVGGSSTAGAGGSTGAGGSPGSACLKNEDCVWCAYPTAPTSPAESYCPGAYVPLAQAACVVNQAASAMFSEVAKCIPALPPPPRPLVCDTASGSCRAADVVPNPGLCGTACSQLSEVGCALEPACVPVYEEADCPVCTGTPPVACADQLAPRFSFIGCEPKEQRCGATATGRCGMVPEWACNNAAPDCSVPFACIPGEPSQVAGCVAGVQRASSGAGISGWSCFPVTSLKLGCEQALGVDATVAPCAGGLDPYCGQDEFRPISAASCLDLWCIKASTCQARACAP